MLQRPSFTITDASLGVNVTSPGVVSQFDVAAALRRHLAR